MQDKKNQNLFWGLFVGGAVLFVLVLAIANPDTNSSEPTGPVATDPLEVTVQENDWVLGNPEASVVLVEYADFQCPACATYHEVVKEVMETYGDRIQYVYRHYPLTQIHRNAIPAAQASEAAGLQGKFFEMQDLLFERQSDWSNDNAIVGTFEDYANELGLDVEQFKTDYASDAVSDKVRTNLREAQSLGLTGTPSFILDGRVLTSPPGNAEGFGRLLDQRLKFTEILGDDTSESSETE